MKFEDLLKKPLHEMDDADIEEIVRTLNEEQLRALEAKTKKALRKRKVSSKKKKENEELFKKLLAGGSE